MATMTRQHFERIAWALRQCHPWLLGYVPGSDEAFYREREWETTVSVMAYELASTNPRFDADRFEQACGLQRRPDGSMYPMTPPR